MSVETRLSRPSRTTYTAGSVSFAGRACVYTRLNREQPDPPTHVVGCQDRAPAKVPGEGPEPVEFRGDAADGNGAQKEFAETYSLNGGHDASQREAASNP